MIRSGFTLVFGGDDFHPDDFLRDSVLTSLDHAVYRRGDSKSGGGSRIEFFDIHNGTYPLCIATELFDLLRCYRDEFIRLSRFPGVDIRTVNLFGDTKSMCFEFHPPDIALLHELSMLVSIFVD